jgi:hypothetical protein
MNDQTADSSLSLASQVTTLAAPVILGDRITGDSLRGKLDVRRELDVAELANDSSPGVRGYSSASSPSSAATSPGDRPFISVEISARRDLASFII